MLETKRKTFFFILAMLFVPVFVSGKEDEQHSQSVIL